MMLNHFQLLTLTASFDLKWPSQLRDFFSIVKPISEAATQFLSFDCFLGQQREGALRTYYLKVVLFALAPGIVIGAAFFVWRAVFKYQERKTKGVVRLNPELSSQRSLNPKRMST
jgi:hypothetical protein